MPDKSITATLLNGAIRSSEQEEMALLLRRKSQYLIAYGSCAHLGGIPGLANQFSRDTLMKFYFEDGPSTVNEARIHPRTQSMDAGHTVTLPELRHLVRALDQVVPVDYYIPGCPPTPKVTKSPLAPFFPVTSRPKAPSWRPTPRFATNVPAKPAKPTNVAFSAFRRPHLTSMDPDLCFLAQGIVCMGPGTRAGCEALCPNGNMPCSGCFGPTSRVRDQGAKILSSLAANVNARTEKEIDEILDGIPDPVGTFYRYGLAKSLLRRRADLDLPPASTPTPAPAPAVPSVPADIHRH
jgi:F420-non-reducing hydrogenase small subunit